MKAGRAERPRQTRAAQRRRGRLSRGHPPQSRLCPAPLQPRAYLTPARTLRGGAGVPAARPPTGG